MTSSRSRGAVIALVVALSVLAGATAAGAQAPAGTAAATPPPTPVPPPPAPDWGAFTMTDRAHDVWFRQVPEGGIGVAIPSAALGYAGLGVLDSLGTRTASDGFASALYAQPFSIARDLSEQTLLNTQLFRDPAVNFAASTGINTGVIVAGDVAARELQAATGLGITPMGRRMVAHANTLPLGDRARMLDYVLTNGGRANQRLSTYQLGSGMPATMAGIAGLIYAGDNFVIPPVDQALSPGLQTDAAGQPVLADDAAWLRYHLPRALNIGTGVSLPVTLRALRQGRTPQQTAVAGGVGFALPAGVTLATNTVVNPPQQGAIRTVGVPVAEGLTRVADGVGGWWEQVDERPEGIVDPWARLDGLAVQTGAAVLGPVADVAGQLGTLGAGRYVAGRVWPTTC